MIDTTSIDRLQEGLRRVQNTRPVAAQLLDDISNKKLQKDFIVESFMIEKFQSDYKEWEANSKQEFINNEISQYNHKLGQITRLNYEVEQLTQSYESKQEDVKLPLVKLSILTIKEYDESLLNRIEAEHKHKQLPTPEEIRLDEVFSLDGKELPSLDLDIFTKLMTIEFRLRIERMIKYEILLRIKKELTAINRKWSSRNASLEGFINGKLKAVMQEVDDIRQLADENEYDVDDEEDIEPEEQELEENEPNDEQEEEEQDYEDENEQQDADEKEKEQEQEQDQDQDQDQEQEQEEEQEQEQDTPRETYRDFSREDTQESMQID